MAEGIVNVHGVEFTRRDGVGERRTGVSYVAADGVRLRSISDVEKYLKKAGLHSSLPHALSLFTFEDAAEGSSLKSIAISAKETPVKVCKSNLRNSPVPEASSLKRATHADCAPSRGAAKRQAEKNDNETAEPAEPEFKKRNRELAMSRAASFARGRGFVDDDDREPSSTGSASKKSKKGKEKVVPAEIQGHTSASAGCETEGERESWPGPCSTASDLYAKRDAAVEARKSAGVPAGTDKKVVLWQPAASAQDSPPRDIPSLQNMCLDIVSTHIESCLEDGLGSILPDMKAKICANLCRKRRLLPDVLPIFTDCETAVLSLPDCSYIGEHEMAAAFERCQGPALEVVELKYCGRSMSDKLLSDLCYKASNLHTLQLGGCYRLSDKGIGSAVTALPQLRVLELSDCRNISVEALRSIGAVADTLESLSLTNCVQLDSEALLQLARFKKLKRLSLAGCRGAADVIVELLAASCGASLEELDLSHLPDSGFSAAPITCRITDASLESIACVCVNLKRLRLRSCDAITDRGLLVLSEGACKQLSHLDLSRCKHLTDAGLASLVTNCRSLSHLSLNAAGSVTCDDDTGLQTHGITDATLAVLADHAFKRLEELDVSWCRGITDEGLGSLTDRAYNLKTLHLRGCGQITEIFLNGHRNASVKVLGRRLHDSKLRAAPRGWCTQ